METLEAIAKRYSCRKFTDKAISQEDIDKILKAGMQAPVGTGSYERLQITVIQDKKFIKEIGDAVAVFFEKRSGKKSDQNFNESVLVILSSLKYSRIGIEMANAGCVLENMLIAASSLGIDSVIQAGASSAIAENEAMLARLSLPEGFQPILAASFGYAKEKGKPKEHTIVVNKI